MGRAPPQTPEPAPPALPPSRGEWLCAAAAIAVHIGLGLGMIRASSPTYDEPVHLAAGYQDLVAGRYRLNAMDHPPFGEMWGALPLVALRVSPMFSDPELVAGRVYNFADHFLYRNRIGAQRLLDTARVWCLASWGIILGAAVMSWARRLGGPPALAAAGVLFAFCPVLVSNLGVVGTDAASTTLFFATFWALSRPRRSLGVWALAGAAMGLAMASKFNMAVLPALAVVLIVTERRVLRIKWPWAGTAVLALAALAALAAVYRVTSLPVYWEGLAATARRLGEGRPSFLLGAYPRAGALSYFPVALGVKTPLPLLILGGAALAGWLRAPDLARFWVAAPPAAYFLAACLSSTQIGVRHILPVYPFLIVAGAWAAAKAWGRPPWGRAGAAALAGWLAASVLRYHPHHLAYFNEIAGGPAGGVRWLGDSNLDWGQGLKELARVLKERGNPPVYLCYFGVADPGYYGIRYLAFGSITTVDPRPQASEPGPGDPVLLAVSVTNLQAVYFTQRELFSWLKERRPVAAPGYAMRLYDLTGDPEGGARLAALLEGSGNPGAASRLLLHYHRRAGTIPP